MATERQKQIWLAALLIVLAIVAFRAFTNTSAIPPPSSNGPAGAPPPRRAAQPTGGAPDVHLDALDAERPKPAAAERDLFRFKPKPPPPAPKPVVPVVPPAPAGPPPPPPPPPIPYKFIGLVSGDAKKIAVLSDGRGAPVYGREGDIIDGRYRILRIGVESIEMEHIDGQGRQTIRLGGS
jgi:hypothetical protein